MHTPRLRPAPLVAALLIGTAVLLAGQGPGGSLFRDAARGWQAPLARASEAEDLARYQRAGELVEQGLYREALEQLDAIRATEMPSVSARQLRLRRATAALRLSSLPGVDAADRGAEAERTLVELLETQDDDVAAFAFAELARAGARADVRAGFRERTLQHWENSTDLAGAGAHYADLAEILLDPRSAYAGSEDAIVLRMWENLVESDFDAQRLQRLARIVLVGASDAPISGRAWRIVPQWRSPDLATAVARDVLAMDAPAWLQAEAHAELGFDAHRRDDLATAVQHFRRVLELVGPADAQAAQQVSALLTTIVSPSVGLDGAQLYRPGSDHAVRVTWRNLREWELRVRRVDPVDDVRPPLRSDQIHDLAHYFAPDAGLVVLRRARNDELEQRARAQGASAQQRHRERGADLRLDALEPGVYVLEFVGTPFVGDAAPAPARRILVVTRMGVVQQDRIDAPRGARVTDLWTVTMDDGRPVSDLSLVVHVARDLDQGRKVEWSHQTVRTGSDGRALVDGLRDGHAQRLVVGSYRGQPVFFSSSSYFWGQGEEPGLRGLVWSDRPLYRPAETVHLQAFVRRADARRRAVTVPDERTLRLEIRDPRGELLVERDVTLDDNGSVAWSEEISRAAALGTYAVQLWTPQRELAASGTFSVDEYRLPEFAVDVRLDTERRYVLGDTLGVDVVAEYLFGGAVEGTAEVVVTREPVWTIWRPLPWLPFMDEEAAPRGAMKGRAIAPYGWGGGEEVLRTTVPLDAEGRARIAIATQRRPSESGDFRYQVQARVTDRSRREQSGNGTVVVGEHELVSFLYAERHVVAPGDRATVVLRVQDVMGRGAAHDGTWELVRIDAKGRERVLRTEPVRTDDDGTARLVFVPESEGHYRVRYHSTDGRGFAMESDTVVWVADPRTRDLPFADDAIQLIAEQDEVIGDVARVLLVSDTPGAPVLLTRTHAGGSETELVRMKGTAQLLEIPLDDLHRPAFVLHAMRVRDWRVHEARLRVVAPEADRLVHLDLEFDHDEVLPGTRVPLRVRATDASGAPISTLLHLAVVDQAVLQLMPRAWPDPVDVFHRFPLAAEPTTLSMASMLGAYQWYDDEQWEQMELGLADEDDLNGARNEQMASKSFERGQAAPMAMAADGAVMESRAGGGAAEGFVPQSVRTDFRTTALWRVNVATDADGRATIEVPLAESLTQWNATVLALDPQTRTGMAEVRVRTRKPVMVRLNHPRVFRERDAFTIAAVVHNDTDQATEATVQLIVDGIETTPRARTVEVEAHGQARVDWEVQVPSDRLRPSVVRDDRGRIVRTEPASVRVQAAVRSSAGDDAFERTVPLLAFGTGLHLASIARADAGATSLVVDLPADRLVGADTWSLTVAPSLLSTAVEALPYLAEFPYGCTEQTLSRFVPAVAVRAAARALGVRADRIDPELDRKIDDGLARIASMQNSDGGWSWWSGGATDPYITAHALTALGRAAQDGVHVDHGMLERGRAALRALLPRLERRDDDLAYALLALVHADRALGRNAGAQVDDAQRRMAERLFENRDRQSAYARGLLASVLHAYGDVDRARLVLRHLDNDVEVDRVLGTAHWGRTSGYWWRGEGAVEATSFVLQAIVAIQPDHPRRDAIAAWLAHNRRGHRWDSTRSTAHAIYALCDHLTHEDAPRPDFTLVARVGSEEVARVRVTPETLLDAGGRFELPATLLHDGVNTVRVEVQGTGHAWITLEADVFTRATKLRAQGHVLEIEREIVRLVPRRTLGRGIVVFEEALNEGDALASGERLKVRLKIRARHDVDYVVVEDPRPAGTEPVEALSGAFWSGGIGGHREVRDDRTAFFVSQMLEGEAVIEYELRAESPGSFHVAPARAMAMYLPDVAGHSADDALRIVGADGAQ